jgi:hypothetical protein
MPKAKRSVGKTNNMAGSCQEGRHWRCERRDGRCEVSIRADGHGSWQTLAVVSGSDSLIGDVLRLVELMNERPHGAALSRSAVKVLKAVAEEGLTFATEMELEHLIQQLESTANP